MSKDYTIKDNGVISGLPARSENFEYGERYVKCRACGVMRPGKELVIHNGEPCCYLGCNPK